MRRALIVVAKRPEAGQTKTRLTPPLTPQEAVALYRCFLLDTLALMAGIEGVEPVIAYTPETAEGYFRDISPTGFGLTPQVGTDLGERLDNALAQHLAEGFERVAVMNSDGPTLPAAHLREAFQALDADDTDVVLGPSDDGGYYLLGTKRPCPDLLRVPMSTPTVFRDTLAIAKRRGLRVHCLPPWYDVDTVADLERLISHLPTLGNHAAPRTRRFLASWRGVER